MLFDYPLGGLLGLMQRPMMRSAEMPTLGSETSISALEWPALSSGEGLE